MFLKFLSGISDTKNGELKIDPNNSKILIIVVLIIYNLVETSSYRSVLV